MDLGTLISRFGLVLVLVALNGFFVSVEFAVVAARRSKLDQLVMEGDRTAAMVRRWLDDPDRVIAAAQLGITISSLLLGYFAQATVGWLIEPLFRAWLDPAAIGGIARWLPFLISIAIITTLHVVFGEQAPKTAAVRFPEKLLLLLARPMRLFMALFRPFVVFLDKISSMVVRLVGMQPAEGHRAVFTVDELRHILSDSHQSGILDAGEREMLNNIFLFGETIARQVMTPRTEVVAVPVSASLDSLLVEAIESPYTKFPVYDGDLDHVLGIIHVKDVLGALNRSSDERATLTARDLMRDVLIVPETIGVEEVLQTFRTHRTHMAVLIDEFGGTSGLVTLEDLLEEIVGDVQDQFEEEEPDFTLLPDGCFLVSGLVPIESFNEEFHTDVEDPNYDTIAGYLLGQLGRMARVGDTAVIPEGTLRVESLDGLRIDRIRFCPRGLDGTRDEGSVVRDLDVDQR